jgi:hypothetical protein
MQLVGTWWYHTTPGTCTSISTSWSSPTSTRAAGGSDGWHECLCWQKGSNLCEMTAGSWQSFHFSTFIIQGWSDLLATHAPPPQGPFGWQRLSAASRLPFVRCVSEHLHLAPLPVITKCTRYTCLHQVHNSCVYQFGACSYRIRPHIHQGIIFTCTNCSLLE